MHKLLPLSRSLPPWYPKTLPSITPKELVAIVTPLSVPMATLWFSHPEADLCLIHLRILIPVRVGHITHPGKSYRVRAWSPHLMERCSPTLEIAVLKKRHSPTPQPII